MGETAEYAEFVFEYLMREEYLRSQSIDYNFEITHWRKVYESLKTMGIFKDDSNVEEENIFK